MGLSWETPQSLDMAAGLCHARTFYNASIPGSTINNVWYLNYSDRSACRMTGMTRFATFWVEHGVIQARSMSCVSMNRCTVCSATISSASTSERELILNTSTYHQRSRSSRVPGALVDDFNFTL